MVYLISYSKTLELLVSEAAALCYSNKSIDDISKEFEDLNDSFSKYLPLDINKVIELKKDKIKNDIKYPLIDKLIKMGHLSPFEHISFTFLVSMSRISSQQFTRHRIASFSQKSQRYVDESDPKFITPINSNYSKESLLEYNKFIKECFAIYKKLVDSGWEKEDARFVLPNAIETQFFVTMNCRELMYFFTLRCCNRAQWEIRNIANEMLFILRFMSPQLFSNCGPYCFVNNKCNQGNMGCGKIKEIKDKYLNDENLIL